MSHGLSSCQVCVAAKRIPTLKWWAWDDNLYFSHTLIFLMADHHRVQIIYFVSFIHPLENFHWQTKSNHFFVVLQRSSSVDLLVEFLFCVTRRRTSTLGLRSSYRCEVSCYLIFFVTPKKDELCACMNMCFLSEKVHQVACLFAFKDRERDAGSIEQSWLLFIFIIIACQASHFWAEEQLAEIMVTSDNGIIYYMTPIFPWKTQSCVCICLTCYIFYMHCFLIKMEKQCTGPKQWDNKFTMYQTRNRQTSSCTDTQREVTMTLSAHWLTC